MDEKLITILETFDYPVYRQGSMEESTQYPPTFFTFWNPDSPTHAYYDNKDYGIAWEFQVNVYSNDPSITYTLLEQARKKLKTEGWVIPDNGHDVGSDEVSHTGRGMTCYFLEIQEDNDNE